MDRKTRTMRFLTGSPTRMTFLIVLAFFLSLLLYGALRYAEFGRGRPDVRFTVRDSNRTMISHPTEMALGSSGFKAVVGPSRYSDKNNEEWDYYEIEVVKPAGTSSQIFFARDFRMDEIPAELVDKKANDIVTFDEEAGVVTFTLGSEIHTWMLPRR
jgi:hypothetical protein